MVLIFRLIAFRSIVLWWIVPQKIILSAIILQAIILQAIIRPAIKLRHRRRVIVPRAVGSQTVGYRYRREGMSVHRCSRY